MIHLTYLQLYWIGYIIAFIPVYCAPTNSSPMMNLFTSIFVSAFSWLMVAFLYAGFVYKLNKGNI